MEALVSVLVGVVMWYVYRSAVPLGRVELHYYRDCFPPRFGRRKPIYLLRFQYEGEWHLLTVTFRDYMGYPDEGMVWLYVRRFGRIKPDLEKYEFSLSQDWWDRDKRRSLLSGVVCFVVFAVLALIFYAELK